MIEQIVAEFEPQLIDIRRDLHANPELQFEEHRTSAIVAQILQELGFEVTTGIAVTGVIGTLRNGSDERAIAIRADMDALPINETTGVPYASCRPGVMHACGHDGHTTMLLGLAFYLSANRNFDGTVHLIFQPAEEDISGALRMVEEGIFDRFPVDAVFGLHNMPGYPVGQVLVRPGAITAAVDIVSARIIGVAGHGALPHQAVDPVVAASSAVMALQTAVARNADPLEPTVVTVGAINGGVMATAIPEEVSLKIGVRTTSEASRALMEKRIPEILQQQAASFGCRAEVVYGEGYRYPVGVNNPQVASLVRDIAVNMGQDPRVVDLPGPIMFSEDFAYFLQQVPGCYFGFGSGDIKSLHDPGYDFNDAALVPGVAFWARIVEAALPAQ
ncbi:M20 aminoacylase family protein [Aestuariivirga sp.]|uniref:M20 aminoacylase family protein n=1 Tax=Aestuariivirga sp. TaxID=2650926 RepID=UPI0039E27566